MGITDLQRMRRLQECLTTALTMAESLAVSLRQYEEAFPVTSIDIYDERFPREGCPRTSDHDDHLWWSNGTALLCAGPGASVPSASDTIPGTEHVCSVDRVQAVAQHHSSSDDAGYGEEPSCLTCGHLEGSHTKTPAGYCARCPCPEFVSSVSPDDAGESVYDRERFREALGDLLTEDGTWLAAGFHDVWQVVKSLPKSTDDLESTIKRHLTDWRLSPYDYERGGPISANGEELSEADDWAEEAVSVVMRAIRSHDKAGEETS